MQTHDCVVSDAYEVAYIFHLFHIAIMKEVSLPVVWTYMEQGERCCGIIDHKFLAII